MSAHPSSWNRQLVERFEPLRREVRENSSLASASEKPLPDQGITLKLHGDLNSHSAPYLEGVLNAVALLRPVHLAIDLSDVGRVGREALRMIDRVGDAIGTWAVLDPSPPACADLVDLARSDLVETGPRQSATASARALTEGELRCMH